MKRQLTFASLLFVAACITGFCACNATPDGKPAASTTPTANASTAVSGTLADSVASAATADEADGQASPELAAAVSRAASIAKSRGKVNTAVGPRSKSAADPTGFVLISDVIPDVVTEARYYTTYNFVGTRVDGYAEPVALCTREAAAALKRVADYLRPKGYLLKIYDAYRPQLAVNHFVRWAQGKDTKMKAQFYPDLNKSSLFPTYIARKSGHTKGSTFDLTIVHAATGKEVDMGGTFDFFGNISHYSASGLTSQQEENRRILHDAMVSHGFKPYSNEWWHFTLKNEPYPNTYFTFEVSSKLMK